MQRLNVNSEVSWRYEEVFYSFFMFKTITPINNTVYLEREYDSAKIEDTISNSVIAQKEWASLEVNERV